MRKVLLATTALLAVNVSAAQADLSISGQGVFEIANPNDGAQTFSTDGAIKIKGTSTADSGLTFTAFVEQKFEGVKVGKGANSSKVAATGSYTQNNDSWLEVSGDFGSIRAGSTDDALDLNDGALAANMDLETTGTPSYNSGSVSDSAITGTAIGGDGTQIGYTSPAIGGAKVYISVDADGANTEYGINYTMGPVTLMAQSNETSAVAGASFTAGNFKIGMGSRETDSTATRGKITSNDIGISYTMGDLMFVATSAQGKEANSDNRKDNYSNVGVSYTVAPGVTAMVESANYDRNDDTSNDGASTWFGLSVDF
jgi:hypothetical protein